MSDSEQVVPAVGDVEAALRAARIAEPVQVLESIHRHDYVVYTDPNGERAVLVVPDHPSADAPRALKSAPRFAALSSFLEYVRPLSGEHTRIAVDTAADPGRCSVLCAEAVIDFPYDQNSRGPAGADLANWGRHRPSVSIGWHPRAADWLKGFDGPQIDLIAWLQDHAADVVATDEPERAARVADEFGLVVATRSALITAVKSLKVTQNLEVAETQNLANGTAEIVFKSTQGPTAVRVPEAVLVDLWDAEHEVSVRVPVAVRYAVRDGRITWSLKVLQREDVVRQLRDAVIAKIGEAEFTVYAGTFGPFTTL